MSRTAEPAEKEVARKATKKPEVAQATEAIAPSTAGSILRLQRMVGNAAVARILQRHPEGAPLVPDAPKVEVASNSQVPSLDQGLQDALRNKPQAKKFVPPVSQRPT